MNSKFIIFIMMFILFSCNRNSKTIAIKNLSGFWINNTYASIVSESKSPKKAFQDDEIYLCFFEVLHNGLRWGIHEGNGFGVDYLKETNKKDEYVLYNSENKALGHKFVFHGDSLNELTWIMSFEDDHQRKEEFIKVQNDINTWVNGQVIAGKYLDENGNEYTFLDDGEANWPNLSFKYKISLGGFWYHDSFSARVKGELFHYGFKWEKGVLFLYNMKSFEGESVVFEQVHFAKLIPIN